MAYYQIVTKITLLLPKINIITLHALVKTTICTELLHINLAEQMPL